MKLRDIGQAGMAGAVSLGLVLGIASCGQDNTIDYIYVANAKNVPGQIDVFLLDHHTGTLTQIKQSPYSSGGQNPQSIAATPNGKYLYVANHDDNSIVEFTVNQPDATITAANTYNTAGSYPTALAVDSTGTYLFVTDAFAPGGTPASPGPGALFIYPINGDGSLGTALSYTSGGVTTGYFPTCNNPVALTVLNNLPVAQTAGGSSTYAVYVLDDPASQPPRLATTGTGTETYTASGACTATTGQITGYVLPYTNSGTVNTPKVALSASGIVPVAGSPFNAGTGPSAIASDIQDRFVYVTDLVSNQLLAYGVSGPGVLTALNNGPFVTGKYPDAITIDPTNRYIYVANFKDNSLSAYQITGNGVPSSLAASTTTTGTSPDFVYIEPSNGVYMYTANFLDNTLTGAKLNIHTGALSGVENSPFAASGQPTSITAVSHGSHSSEILPIY